MSLHLSTIKHGFASQQTVLWDIDIVFTDITLMLIVGYIVQLQFSTYFKTYLTFREVRFGAWCCSLDSPLLCSQGVHLLTLDEANYHHMKEIIVAWKPTAGKITGYFTSSFIFSMDASLLCRSVTNNLFLGHSLIMNHPFNWCRKNRQTKLLKHCWVK